MEHEVPDYVHKALMILDQYTGLVTSEKYYAQGHGFSNPETWFRRLTIIPRQIGEQGIALEFEILDCDQTPLCVVPNDQLEQVVRKLTTLNSVCPGGATYVLRGSDSIIRRWQSTQQRLDKYAAETRIDELPALARGGRQKDKQAVGNALLEGLDLGDLS